MSDIEKVILRNLQYQEVYARKVMPFIKDEYFTKESERVYFQRIHDYFTKYNALPDKDALAIDFKTLKTTQGIFDELNELVVEFDKQKTTETNIDWLLEQSESFCKDQSLHLALVESLEIAGGKSQHLSTTAIPDILSKALAVSFDTNIGHDYYNDTDKRFEYYNRKTVKIPFHLDSLNDITGGGAERKTINVIAAGTGVGKSMLMCDLSANYIKQGYNVLYITMEMAEEKIAQRIDANLMNVNIGDINDMGKPIWDDKVAALRQKARGHLKIKEYPTGSAHVGHFKFLLRELKQKQNFVPDIICIDYMNICASAKMKNKNDMYGYVKAIAEEIRGFAVETNAMIWTATQLNRDGIDNSDADLKNISESMGGPHTFDFLIAIISNDELAALNQVFVKQLKNRYGDLFYNNKFPIGIDRPKMKFYDLTNRSTTMTPVAKTQHSAIHSKSPNSNTPKKNLNFNGIKT